MLCLRTCSRHAPCGITCAAHPKPNAHVPLENCTLPDTVGPTRVLGLSQVAVARLVRAAEAAAAQLEMASWRGADVENRSRRDQGAAIDCNAKSLGISRGRNLHVTSRIVRS